MSDALYSARDLCRSFSTGGRVIEVLRGLDFQIEARERLAVLGNSGVGKSTLLHILGTLDRAVGDAI